MARALENPESKPPYLDYFGMTRPPFDALPGPSPIFLSDQYSLLTAHLTSATEQTDCLMVICGADGSGKTTLLNRYISSMSDDVSFAAFDETCKTGTEFYSGFLRQLGFRDITGSLRELRRITREFLIHRGKAGDPVLVIVDNAHLICASVYEQLRWILETKVDDRRVLSVVLAGNKSLHRIMDSPAMQSINFRSNINFNIRVYTEEETEDYVRHRLRLAGGIEAAKFANEARPLIYRYSGGVPSSINMLCDEVLAEAYTRETRVISADLVRIVADTHQIKPPVLPPLPKGRRKTDPDIDLLASNQPEARITGRKASSNTAAGSTERDSGQSGADIAALSAQVGLLSKQLADVEAARNQTLTKLDGRDKDVDKLQKQLAALLKKSEKQENAAEDNAEKVRELKRDLSDTKKALRASEKTAEKAIRSSEEPNVKLEKMQVEVDRLTDELATLEDAGKQAQTEIRTRDERVSDLEKRLDTQTKKAEKQQHTAEEKTDLLRQLKQELTDTTKALRASQKAAEQTALDSELSDADVGAMQLQVDELRVQLSTLETAEKQAQLEISARDKDVAKLEKQLGAQTRAADKRADDILKLKESLSESKVALQNSEKGATELAAALKKEERLTGRANSELTKLNTKLEKLEDSKSELRTKVGTLTKELREANKRVNKSHVLEKSNESLKHKIETKTEQLSARDKTLTELEKTLQKTQEECDSLRSSAESQNALEANVKKKDALIANLETELAAANSRSSMGKDATERPADAINALEIMKGGKVKQVFHIGTDQSRIMIGRSDDSDLCLESKFVSRHHALVFITDHRVYIEDLNSFNGVVVNSKTIARMELHENDTVLVGDFVIRPTHT